MSLTIDSTHRNFNEDQDNRNLVTTSKQGVIELGCAAFFFGVGGILKIQDYLQGQKTAIPLVTDDAARFHVDIGKDLMKSGVAKAAPVLTVACMIYVFTKSFFTS